MPRRGPSPLKAVIINCKRTVKLQLLQYLSYFLSNHKKWPNEKMRFSFLYLLYFNKKGHVLCNSTRDCFYITIQIDLISVQVSWCLVLMESFVCKILLPLRILPQWNTWGSNERLYIVHVECRYRKLNNRTLQGMAPTSLPFWSDFLNALLCALLFALLSPLWNPHLDAKILQNLPRLAWDLSLLYIITPCSPARAKMRTEFNLR